jgi:hypothetical protein
MDWLSFFIGLCLGGAIMFLFRRPRRRVDVDRPPTSPPRLPDDLKQQVLKLRAEGRLMEAIKLVKERMNCGLKEAKDAVDELR